VPIFSGKFFYAAQIKILRKRIIIVMAQYNIEKKNNNSHGTIR
jgi:hypothetical protein